MGAPAGADRDGTGADVCGIAHAGRGRAGRRGHGVAAPALGRDGARAGTRDGRDRKTVAYQTASDAARCVRSAKTCCFDFKASLGTGVDKVANHAFHPQFILDHGRLAKESTGTSFRCDSASYINAGNTPGYVFPQTHPTLIYDAKLQPNAKDTIAHIRLALTKPNSTQPLRVGSDVGKKTIPSVQHRQTSKSKNRANNRAAAVCRSIDPSYVSKGNDCDEFPFESSQEGAAKADKRFSVLPVRLGDNRSAGNTLGNFYTDLRILEGEEYHVAVPR